MSLPEETKEKRRHPRVAAQVRVRYRILQGTNLRFIDDEAVSRDMGLGGLALVLRPMEMLGKDDMVSLEILDGEARGVRAYAEVAWSQAERAGLRFMGVEDQDLERLRLLFAKSGVVG